MPELDHAAYFLPDIASASAALTALGYTLTPFSSQSHRLDPGAPLTPAGTGNRCVMLPYSYLEFLTPTLQTPNAAALRAAISRYTGTHLVAFGTESALVDYERLVDAGFAPLPPVVLQRQVGIETSEATARFTVVRLPPAAMAEGRSGEAWWLNTARGYLVFVSPALLQQKLGVAAPTLPWIAGCIIDSSDMAVTRAWSTAAAWMSGYW
jgi:hypothetical protein